MRSLISLDYISNLYIHQYRTIPKIRNQQSDYLLLSNICPGKHEHLDEFMSHLSELYKIILVVPGPLEFQTLREYDELFYRYSNIGLLNDSIAILDNMTVIGSTYPEFVERVDKSNMNNIIALTHYAPNYNAKPPIKAWIYGECTQSLFDDLYCAHHYGEPLTVKPLTIRE